ncbi:aspartic peptidase domain-containing protein [Cantharellus anzutake]|uniref:aspartic peptidase domain-containing protein n=1 Tax=Cantharellus anzutake TaxID=1750568 RepID=UPI00190601B8|nr:aspartic peptidase domain-containing protein [Cantharellus anzutake]KAF8327717.1 aspartic peptidase domain-containing protein [Cantharellus anzutake]
MCCVVANCTGNYRCIHRSRPALKYFRLKYLPFPSYVAVTSLALHTALDLLESKRETQPACSLWIILYLLLLSLSSSLLSCSNLFRLLITGHPTDGSVQRELTILLAHRAPRRFNAEPEVGAWAAEQGARSKYGLAHSDGATSKRAEGLNLLVNIDRDTSYFGSVAIDTPPALYNIILDTTLRPFVTYGSGAAGGHLVQDSVQMAGFSNPKQVFASCNQMTKDLLFSPISGLMGLAWKSLAASGSTPFWQALVAAIKVQRNSVLNETVSAAIDTACSMPVNVTFAFGGGKDWSMAPADFQLQQILNSDCLGAFFEIDPTGSSPPWIISNTYKNVMSVFKSPSVGFAQLSSAARELGSNTVPTPTIGTSTVSPSDTAGAAAALLGGSRSKYWPTLAAVRAIIPAYYMRYEEIWPWGVDRCTCNAVDIAVFLRSRVMQECYREHGIRTKVCP